MALYIRCGDSPIGLQEATEKQGDSNLINICINFLSGLGLIGIKLLRSMKKNANRSNDMGHHSNVSWSNGCDSVGTYFYLVDHL